MANLLNFLKIIGKTAANNPKSAAALAALAGTTGYNMSQNQPERDIDNEPLIPKQDEQPVIPADADLMNTSPLLTNLREDAATPAQPGFNKYTLPPITGSNPIGGQEESPVRDVQAIPSAAEPTSQMSKFQQILNQQLSTPAPKRNIELNLPDQTKNYQAAYDRARSLSEENKNSSRLGKALDIAGAGIVGIGTKAPIKPVMQEYFDEKLKNAEVPLEDFKNKLVLEKKDPNSAYSQGLKQFLTSYGVKVNGPLDAETAEKLIPNITKIYENDFNKEQARNNMLIHALQADEGAKNRALTAKLSADARKDAQTDKATEKSVRNLEVDKQKLGMKLNEDLASSRSALGIAARNKQAVQNAQALIDGNVDLNTLDNREVYELAKVLDRILSQGQSTISGSEKLTPDTARGKMAKYTEFLTNKRQGAGAADFVKRYQKTLQRESDVSDRQIKKASADTLLGFKHIADKDPEGWDLILRSKGLPSDLFKDGKTYQDNIKENAPVKVRNKATGQVKELSAQDAKSVLDSPNYEKVD